MNQDFLLKLLDADISRESKEKILEYWLLPPKEEVGKAPIQKSNLPSGVIRRPNKEELELRKNPKKREEQAEMEKTLDEMT